MTFNFEIYSAIVSTLLALSEFLPIVTKGKIKGVLHGLYNMRYNCWCLSGELSTETVASIDQDLQAQPHERA
jgi:hypothetical protein